MSDPCLLCADWTIIHPHRVGSYQDGSPVLAWVPSTAVLEGQDRFCPACDGGNGDGSIRPQRFDLVNDPFMPGQDDRWCELDCLRGDPYGPLAERRRQRQEGDR